MHLERLGWDEEFARRFEPYESEGCTPARVGAVHRGAYLLITESGEVEAEASGRMFYEGDELPVTGDWVALRPGGRLIESVLPRRSSFRRRNPGTRVEVQVLAANLDLLFLVAGLDGDFNLRRLERYLVLAAECGCRAVVVLNKADLCTDLQGAVCAAESLGAPVVAVSATRGDNVEALSGEARPGTTAAFLGSSGAGKSTLVNALIGSTVQATRPVREHDSRGRHTTTQRELIMLPEGWMVIDMPGLREVALWANDDGLAGAFADVEELASQCRFRDCTHQSEPGCAVRDSMDDARLGSYNKLRKELDWLHRQQDPRAAAENKAKWKQIHKALRKHPKYR
jgi:ribosome biogenesis GTPase